MVYNRKLITEQWANVTKKDGTASSFSISDIEDRYIKESTAVVLENQKLQYNMVEACINPEMLFEASNNLGNIGGNTDGVSDTTSYQFQPISLALARRSHPALFAHKVVGVQPMSSPVGLAYALRKVYASNNTDNLESGFDHIPEWAGYTGSTPQTSAILDDTVAGIYDTSASSAVATTAEAWEMGTDYPQLKIKIDKQTIEAGTRKLGTSYSLESAMDLQAMLGIDIQREMVDELEYELVAELDRELVYRMKKAATDVTQGGAIIAAVDVSGTELDGRWSQEKFSNITNAIIHQANVISYKTHEGAGNFCIVSPTVATVLQSAPPGVFNKNVVTVGAPLKSGVSEIGSINGGAIKIYLDSQARTDFALVGYKGPKPNNSGIIYSPYVMGLKSFATNYKTFEPNIGILSRDSISDNMLGRGRYYRLIPFTNLNTIIPTA